MLVEAHLQPARRRSRTCEAVANTGSSTSGTTVRVSAASGWSGKAASAIASASGGLRAMVVQHSDATFG